MKTSIGGLLFGISLKLIIIALYYNFHLKIDSINLKSPAVFIEKIHSAFIQTGKLDETPSFVYTIDPHQISAVKKRKKNGRKESEIMVESGVDVITVNVLFYDGSLQKHLIDRKALVVDELFSAVAKKREKAENNLKFVFKGSVLVPQRDTASMVAMENDAIIHCMLHGNHDESYPVYVVLVNPDGSKEYRKLQSKTPMVQLFSSVAGVLGKVVSDLMFTFNEIELKPSDTATELKMTDRDVIYCILIEKQISIEVHFPHFIGMKNMKMLINQYSPMSETFELVMRSFGKIFDEEIYADDLEFTLDEMILKPDYTANILEMRDRDVIYCWDSDPVWFTISFPNGAIREVEASKRILVKNIFSTLFVSSDDTVTVFDMVHAGAMACLSYGRELKLTQTLRKLEIDDGDEVDCIVVGNFKNFMNS
jgi:hypothetical protein